MAQAEPEPGDGDDDVETCRVAMEAALEKGLNFCDSREARLEVLGKNVGLTGSDVDFDADAVLDAGPEGSSRPLQTRQWVLARADEIIAAGESDPLDAINQAWGEVADEAGDDPDDPDEPDEPDEPDDPDEEPVADDEDTPNR